MVYNRKTILSTMVLFIVFLVNFLFFIACDGLYPKPEPVTYVITASAGNNGSIEPEGEIVVNEGQNQTFTIIPDAGYKIDNVLINGESIGVVEAYTFTDIDHDCTIEVTFEKKYSAPATPSAPTYYTISASSEIGGSIEPEGTIKLKKGSSQTFTITPLPPCYEIKEVLIDGISVGQPTTYTFDSIQKDYSIEVYFNLSDKKIRRYNLDGELQNDNYSKIQEAIDDDDASDGDIIIVCPGIYNGNLIFNGSKKIIVQSVEPKNEDIVSATIIDGGADGSVAHFSNSDASTLQGLTLTNGSGTANVSGTSTSGGGIYINSSSPNILYNIIENNESTNGGGIYIAGNSSPEIKDNTIRNNESTNMAGGIYIFRGSANIIDNIISENSTKEYGGGVYVYEGYEEPVGGIVNNIIDNNVADYGGGIYLSKTSPELESNDIKGNTANNDGGGINLNSSSPNITGNNIITENTADKGGGLYIEDSYNSTTQNSISGNSITKNTASSSGGGIYLNNSTPIIAGNNNIYENEAQWGGGIYMTSSSPKINSNRITENIATGFGGGINIKDSNPEIGGVDENDTDNFNIICSNSPDQIKSGTSYPFNEFGYSVALSVNNVDYGTVTGEGDYCEGSQVQLEAISEEGYYFINWTADEGNEISTDNPYNFSMPAEDVVITANFEIN